MCFGNYKNSVSRRYYAPFYINSKNFTHVPEETKQWFDILADFLYESTNLSKQGGHLKAVECFSLLYKLIEQMENGEEIVFADELGSWMIPIDEKEIIEAYLTSLAASKSPEEFAEEAANMVRRDSFESFSNKVYSKANRIANNAQKTSLRKEIKKQKIRTRS